MRNDSFLQGYDDCINNRRYGFKPGYNRQDSWDSTEYAKGWDAALDSLLTIAEDKASRQRIVSTY